MINNTSEIFGVDIKSVNSIENILNTFTKGNEEFPKRVNGKYAIVSYPLHLKRFEKIFNALQEKGKISNEVELEYIPTKESLREFLYHAFYEKIAIRKMKKSLEDV